MWAVPTPGVATTSAWSKIDDIVPFPNPGKIAVFQLSFVEFLSILSCLVEKEEACTSESDGDRESRLPRSHHTPTLGNKTRPSRRRGGELRLKEAIRT